LKNGCLPPDQRAGGVEPETSRPLVSAHPTGGRSQNFSQTPPEGLFTNKKLFLFAKRLLTRPLRHPASPTGWGSPKGHPARPTGGTFHYHYISPHLPPNSHIIQQKSEKKKEREERKRGEQAVKPYSHVGLEVYSRYSRIIT
jgi:hypothetical protein